MQNKRSVLFTTKAMFEITESLGFLAVAVFLRDGSVIQSLHWARLRAPSRSRVSNSSMARSHAVCAGCDASDDGSDDNGGYNVNHTVPHAEWCTRHKPTRRLGNASLYCMSFTSREPRSAPFKIAHVMLFLCFKPCFSFSKVESLNSRTYARYTWYSGWTH